MPDHWWGSESDVSAVGGPVRPAIGGLDHPQTLVPTGARMGSHDSHAPSQVPHERLDLSQRAMLDMGQTPVPMTQSGSMTTHVRSGGSIQQQAAEARLTLRGTQVSQATAPTHSNRASPVAVGYRPVHGELLPTMRYGDIRSQHHAYLGGSSSTMAKHGGAQGAAGQSSMPPPPSLGQWTQSRQLDAVIPLVSSFTPAIGILPPRHIQQRDQFHAIDGGPIIGLGEQQQVTPATSPVARPLAVQSRKKPAAKSSEARSNKKRHIVPGENQATDAVSRLEIDLFAVEGPPAAVSERRQVNLSLEYQDSYDPMERRLLLSAGTQQTVSLTPSFGVLVPQISMSAPSSTRNDAPAAAIFPSGNSNVVRSVSEVRLGTPGLATRRALSADLVPEVRLTADTPAVADDTEAFHYQERSSPGPTAGGGQVRHALLHPPAAADLGLRGQSQNRPPSALPTEAAIVVADDQQLAELARILDGWYDWYQTQVTTQSVHAVEGIHGAMTCRDLMECVENRRSFLRLAGNGLSHYGEGLLELLQAGETQAAGAGGG
ncbi:hypothetical protein K461DRAFT_67091 [Myriangium duriaei CBS 260.36]|uniref:Uncharacterized protein n=1 Tax=Myriangium duriaei CBS 260.36 TaxID=1168546 RepID=A0A9P4IQ01_9PEZI|nr:hypothetical protein K461DRAFT_67091 [Myriangium duriaei CBS 260.36]